jgi:hypothetical protein
MAIQLNLWFPPPELPYFGSFVPATANDVSGFDVHIQGAYLVGMSNHKTVCISLRGCAGLACLNETILSSRKDETFRISFDLWSIYETGFERGAMRGFSGIVGWRGRRSLLPYARRAIAGGGQGE